MQSIGTTYTCNDDMGRCSGVAKRVACQTLVYATIRRLRLRHDQVT